MRRERTPIYEKSRLYSACLWLASHYIHHSFRHYKCVGHERIPKDGALIFASNHCDSLMDPLAVLAIDGSTKVFVARADIFNSFVAHKILTFMKILPIHRMRDGLHNVIKTEDTIEKSIDVVEHNVNFCIFPEGRHRTMHSLLPFGKGLSRIALGAYRRLEGKKQIYIVPVGCEYNDYFRYRSTLLINVGEPINVSKYIEENGEMSENDLLQGLKTLTADAIREQILYIPDDENYEPVWTLSRIATGRIPKRMQEERLEANRASVRRLLNFKEKNPVEATELFSRVMAFDKARRRAKISLNAFAPRKKGLYLAGITTALVALFPLFTVAATISLPTWVTAEILACIVRDPAFRNPLRCATITMLWSLLLIFAVIPAPFFTYDYFELARQTASSWRNMFAKKLNTEYETLYSIVGSLPDAD